MSIQEKNTPMLPDEAQRLFVLAALGKRLHTDALISWDAYRRRDVNITDGKRLGTSSIVVLYAMRSHDGMISNDRLELSGTEDVLSGDTETDGQVLQIINALIEGAPEVPRAVQL